jgi:CRISPR-associated protein Cmr6
VNRVAAPKAIEAFVRGDLPPGHRFALYLPLWTERWEIADGAKLEALKSCCALGKAKGLLTALRRRQQAQVEVLPVERRLVINAMTISPFATGLGNEHPVENGFAFLSPYGLPYLAGSGVKGVLRRSMEELRGEGTAGIDAGLINALFGPEDGDADGSGPILADDQRHRGALVFWDVYPEPHHDQLCVEVMTPHQGAYYQGEQSPHDAGQPVPIFFLAIPPQSRFLFIVTCEPALLPAEHSSIDWQAPLKLGFQRAFDWSGFGAKTAVGYGAMKMDQTAQTANMTRQVELEQRRAEDQARLRLQEELAKASPTERLVIEVGNERADKNQPVLNALIDGLAKGRFGDFTSEVAYMLMEKMQSAKRWKEVSTKKNPEKDHDFQDTLKVKKYMGRK